VAMSRPKYVPEAVVVLVIVFGGQVDQAGVALVEPYGLAADAAGDGT